MLEQSGGPLEQGRSGFLLFGRKFGEPESDLELNPVVGSMAILQQEPQPIAYHPGLFNRRLWKQQPEDLRVTPPQQVAAANISGQRFTDGLHDALFLP